MNSETWYVRHGTDILGPIRQAELLDLARRGALQSETAVSADATQWIEARHVPEIVFGPPTVPEAPRPESLFRHPKRLAGWIAGAAGIVLLNLCLCSSMYLMLWDVEGMNVPEPDPANSLSQRILGRPAQVAPAGSQAVTRAALQGAISLAITDGSEELKGIVLRLPPADQQSIVRDILNQGLDLYAYRIQIRNTGRDPIDIDPQWLKLRAGETEVPLWDDGAIHALAPDGQPFLQATRLAPGASISGLVGFTTRPEVAEVIRNGHGVMTYNDFTVSVTYE